MKLVRHGAAGAERPGMLDAAGRVRDLSGAVGDIAGDALSPAGLEALAALDPGALPLVAEDTRLGPCVGGVGKIVCAGLNYADHAAEAGLDLPPEPILFFKATSALCGPTDPLILPRGQDRTDWEVELAVIIGTRAQYVTEAEAMAHVAGYAVFNDVSERSFQFDRAGQWVKGKSADSFAPLGPWLVTADEIQDPQALPLWLEVNGEKMQDGSTETMVFGVAHLVHYISQFMTLEPGDVIATGTPPGVGMGMTPPRYLQAGDRVRLGIAGMGAQQAEVIAAPES